MCRYSFLNAIEKENKTHTHSHIKFDIKFSIKLEYHNTITDYVYSNVNTKFNSKEPYDISMVRLLLQYN